MQIILVAREREKSDLIQAPMAKTDVPDEALAKAAQAPYPAALNEQEYSQNKLRSKASCLLAVPIEQMMGNTTIAMLRFHTTKHR